MNARPLASIGPGRRSATIPMTQRNRLGGAVSIKQMSAAGVYRDRLLAQSGCSTVVALQPPPTSRVALAHRVGSVSALCRVLSRSRAKEAPVSRRSNWLLYLLSGASPRNRSESSIWLDPISVMKALFLAQNESGPDLSARSPVATPPFEFVPYSYGPFTPVVYSELENFEGVGLVQSRQALGRSYSLWALTEAGWSAANSASASLVETSVPDSSTPTAWSRRNRSTNCSPTSTAATPSQRPKACTRPPALSDSRPRGRERGWRRSGR